MNNEEKILSLLEVLTEKIGNLEQGQVKLEQEVRQLNRTVAKIENEHGQILGTLHDGYNLLMNKIENNTELEERVETLEIQMSAVNTKLRNM